jgi:putative ABC transport system permease protein
VIAGTAISTAVLTGALIIGDSVRYSLQEIVDARLGKTQYSISSGSRFISADLASVLSEKIHADATALLNLQGLAIKPETDERLNNVQVIGIDSCFFDFARGKLPMPSINEAMLGENTAMKLNLKMGDQFLLRIDDNGPIPVNSPFSKPAESTAALRLTVSNIANDSCLGRFSLRNNQSSPYNIFVSRKYLAERMKLHDLANIILLGNFKNPKPDLPSIYSEIKKNWTFTDAGLDIKALPEWRKYDLISRRIFIDDAISKKIESLKINHQNILTYLANSIYCGQKATPYSFITASNFPLYPDDAGDDGIIINRWLADDLNAKKGDTVTLEYFIIGPLRKLNERGKTFIVKDILPTEGSDLYKQLMPSFPGLSDAGSCRDWNSGIPIDLKRIRDKDENYWNKYRGSPKAFISLKTGKEIWNNPFGNITAVRFAEKDISADSLQHAIMSTLEPSDIGISVVPAYEEGKASAENSVDFGTLFLSLSIFVIAASLLLTILFYSLNVGSRKTESGLLAALGFTIRQITLLRFSESAFVILTGGIIGSLVGIIYCDALLSGLNSVWMDAVRMNQLKIKIWPSTLIYGSLSGILLGVATIWLVTRHGLKEPVARLLKSIAIPDFSLSRKKIRVQSAIAILGIIASISLLLYSIISGAFQDAGLFLTAGTLFLIGSFAGISVLTVKKESSEKNIHMNLVSLAFRNAGRYSGRSNAVIIIMALGVFSIIVTGAYRKTYYGAENIPQSGTGGYQLWVETSIPVPFDLNSAAGKDKLIYENSKDLDSVRFLQFHSVDGDDASCLNLNQVHKPRLLGIPPEIFDKKHSFSFVNALPGINKDQAWKELTRKFGNNVYNAFADQTVIQYGLKKSLNDTISYLNEAGKIFKLRIAAGLDNSIFQGNLLVSDSILISQFPSAGSTIMLVEVPPDKQKRLSTILQNSLKDYGIEISSAPERLAEFNSVENTYLSVFMVLGALGLIMGTFGLGILLFRNILERRRELAVMLALGFRKSKILLLIVLEYGFLLISGILCGTLSASIAILPSLISPSFHVNLGFIGILLAAIFISGIVWIYIPARNIVKASLIPSLKID